MSNLGAVRLTFTMYDGFLVLSATGGDNFAFTQNITGYQRFPNALIRGMDAKRVIGITQRRFRLDNSWSHNNIFNNGNVATWGRGANGVIQYRWLGRWPAAGNAREFDPTNRDGANNWVVDFAAPYQRANDAAGTTPNAAARYNAETVHISLLRRPPGLAGLRAMRGRGYLGN
jgi:hypothetical protein